MTMSTYSPHFTTTRAGASFLFVLGMAIYWLIVMHLPLSNVGGRGVQLPLNSLSWASILSLIALFWVFPSSCSRATFPVPAMLVGSVLLTLPLLWSPTREMRLNGATAIAGLWGGCLFILTLLRCSLSGKSRHLLLTCMALAGMIQGSLVLMELYGRPEWLPAVWQTFIAKYGRGGVGVFQQVNVTSSFLAMALTVAMLQLTNREARLTHPRFEKARQTVLGAAVTFLTMILVLLYSRTGWLACAVVAAGMIFLVLRSPFRHQAHNGKLLCLLLVAGGVAGLLLLNMSVTRALELHEGSNLQRILTLRNTLTLSLQHPFIGHGAGSYEGLYQNWLAALPGGNPGKEIMAHPHNELLYQFFEGGFVALAGAIIWFCLWLRQGFKVGNLQQAGAWLAMVPVLLHTQLEFPLYYSVPHWLTLLLLFRLSLREEELTQPTSKHSAASLIMHGAMASIAIAGAALAALTFHANQVMDLLEDQKLATPQVIRTLSVPWAARLRYHHDLDLLTLMEFRQKQDRQALETFTQNNALWLSVHADADMYQNQIAVLAFLQRRDQAKAWKEKARRTFPWDERFQ
ncbi:MAG: O-antigen ligase family protein [Scandinavium sp.]|uniref:O-antigen ligase family protein n=1 Tax=Scandinavium sp. TaxID=2830653 RepID=UPI003F2B6089